jgi:hypothetical protein
MVHAWEQVPQPRAVAGDRPARPPHPASQHGPAERPDQVLALQRPVGNAATATHLAGPPAASEEVLTAALADHARTYYQQLPGYRIEQHHTLQELLGLARSAPGPDGGFPIDEAFVQAVARWQRNDRGQPPLPVDGIADFRTLARMFPFGLATAGQPHRYAEAARGELVDRWGELTPAERLDTMERLMWQAMDRAEALPGAVGMPRPRFTHAHERSILAFRASSWTLVLSAEWFERGPQTHSKVPFMVSAGLHELRHAEQNFLVVRTAIGAALAARVANPAAVVARELEVPIHVARAALAAPLPPTSVAALMTGSMESARSDPALRRQHDLLIDAVRQSDAALVQVDAEPYNAANQQVLNALSELRNQIRAEYYAVEPAEQDAETVQEMVITDLVGGTR